MRRSFCAGRAFTLVELMIAVGCVVLLLAILLPVVSKAREAARIAQCTSNLHQIDTAWRAWGQSPENSSSAMRLPGADPIWMNAVITVASNNAILFCPDADQSTYTASTPGTSATFATDEGWVTQSKQYGGNGHPMPTWSPDPTKNPNATTYTLTIQYQNQASRGGAVFTFSQVSGTTWKWTAVRVDNGDASGGKPLTVTWGADKWSNVSTGQTGTHTLTGGTPGTQAAGGSNYGYNVQMVNAFIPKSGRILLMDYGKISLDYTNDTGSTYLKSGRHNSGRTYNALFSDSSVQLLTTKEVTNSMLYFNR